MLSLPSDPPCRPMRFELLADAQPGVLPRILAPFARRGLVPDDFRSRRTGNAVRVDIGMAEMPSGMLHLVEGNLRQVVGVRRLAVVLERVQGHAAV